MFVRTFSYATLLLNSSIIYSLPDVEAVRMQRRSYYASDCTLFVPHTIEKKGERVMGRERTDTLQFRLDTPSGMSGYGPSTL